MDTSIEIAGALLCGAIFLYLYWQSRIIYYALWAAALVLQPLLLAAFSGRPPRAYTLARSVVLVLIYLYHQATLRKSKGLGAVVFQASLALLVVAPLWWRYPGRPAYFDFALYCVLAYAAMAMWGESQIQRLRDVSTELDHVRRESRNRADLDRLTGLWNQSALAARIETCLIFDGVVAVCDMDSFKEINDRFGHMVGDEILRHIGRLLQSSIRQDDEAFRWGGDEFVVVFHDQPPLMAGPRMHEIEARLRDFQVRGYGVLPISFSWGTADGRGRPLREALDEADRMMYQRKRERATGTRAAFP